MQRQQWMPQQENLCRTEARQETPKKGHTGMGIPRSSMTSCPVSRREKKRLFLRQLLDESSQSEAEEFIRIQDPEKVQKKVMRVPSGPVRTARIWPWSMVSGSAGRPCA